MGSEMCIRDRSGGMGRKEEYVTPDQDVCLGRRRKQEANTINEMRPKKYIHIFGCLEGIYIYTSTLFIPHHLEIYYALRGNPSAAAPWHRSFRLTGSPLLPYYDVGKPKKMVDTIRRFDMMPKQFVQRKRKPHGNAVGWKRKRVRYDISKFFGI